RGACGVAACFFFFSSRRRHTRWPRDWSSDVCSSDLRPHEALAGQDHRYLAQAGGGVAQEPRAALQEGSQRRAAGNRAQYHGSARSEERRVGKECRSRWSTDDLKKKENRGEEVCA